jgi:hypothetical protein
MGRSGVVLDGLAGRGHRAMNSPLFIWGMLASILICFAWDHDWRGIFNVLIGGAAYTLTWATCDLIKFLVGKAS